MNKTYVFASLATLALGLASCDDPIAQKEFALASQGQQEGVLVPSIQTTFDKWITQGAYTLPQLDSVSEVSGNYWSSASNEGYGFLSSGAGDFPVTQLDSLGGARIRTLRGMYIFGIGSRVVAGSLYSGQVNSRSLIASPLESTLFGQPYSSGIPQEMTFTYQYQAGEQVIHGQDRRVELPAQDKASASVVFYEVTDDAAFLNGTNLQTDSRIVAKGYVELASTDSASWVSHTLHLDVVDSARYEAINFDTRKYRLAVVFSSSYRGADFIGAIGSELRLKDVVVKDRPRRND